MEIASVTRAPYARILVYGAPYAGKSHLALTFPEPIALDAHGTLGRFERVVNGVVSDDPAVLQELIETLKTSTAQTLIIDTLTGVQARLIDRYLSDRYNKGHLVGQDLKALLAAAFALPMHVVVVAQSRTEYAQPGDVYGGRLVGEDESIPIGDAPDLNRAVLSHFDATIRIARTTHGSIATVRGSRVPGLAVGEVIVDPTGGEILGRLCREEQAPVAHLSVVPDPRPQHVEPQPTGEPQSSVETIATLSKEQSDTISALITSLSLDTKAVKNMLKARYGATRLGEIAAVRYDELVLDIKRSPKAGTSSRRRYADPVVANAT